MAVPRSAGPVLHLLLSLPGMPLPGKAVSFSSFQDSGQWHLLQEIDLLNLFLKITFAAKKSGLLRVKSRSKEQIRRAVAVVQVRHFGWWLLRWREVKR